MNNSSRMWLAGVNYKAPEDLQDLVKQDPREPYEDHEVADAEKDQATEAWIQAAIAENCDFGPLEESEDKEFATDEWIREYEAHLQDCWGCGEQFLPGPRQLEGMCTRCSEQEICGSDR